MASSRRAFTDEFKAEAVRLVTVEGHPVSQVAKDLGLHESLLRRWKRKLEARQARVAGVKPTAAVAASIIVEQEEIRKLKRENERLRMERDVLKKPSPSSRRHRSDVPVHPRPSRILSGASDVPGSGGLAQRLLRLAAAAGEPAGGRGSGSDREDPGGPQREPTDLRQPARARQPEGRGLPDRPQTGGPADARERHPGQDQAQVSGHHRQPSRSSDRAQPARPAGHGRGAEHGVAGRFELHLDPGGLVVSGRRTRPLFPPGGRLGDGRTDAAGADAGCPGYGAQAALPGLMHHSDRGSQYAAGAYQKQLTKHGIVCSMSRKGNCWDNAPMESFFHTLKTELVHHRDYLTRDEARRDIFEYIEVFYNRQRRHSTLGYLSPAQFEVTALAA